MPQTATALKFLSTLSLRRATHHIATLITGVIYFYPRSPCGERRGYFKVHSPPKKISIHALLAESDQLRSEAHSTWNQFLSTLSLRRATHQSPHLSPRLQFLSTLSLRRATIAALGGHAEPHISIHALLAESDCPVPTAPPLPANFYPRSPCGERHQRQHHPSHREHFYPRSPCGERLSARSSM